MVARIGQSRVVNQTTRRQVKKQQYLTNKSNKNLLIIALVSMRMCVQLRSKMFGSCMGRNELILGILKPLTGSKIEK